MCVCVGGYQHIGLSYSFNPYNAFKTHTDQNNTNIMDNASRQTVCAMRYIKQICQSINLIICFYYFPKNNNNNNILPT